VHVIPPFLDVGIHRLMLDMGKRPAGECTSFCDLQNAWPEISQAEKAKARQCFQR